MGLWQTIRRLWDRSTLILDWMFGRTAGQVPQLPVADTTVMHAPAYRNSLRTNVTIVDEHVESWVSVFQLSTCSSCQQKIRGGDRIVFVEHGEGYERGLVHAECVQFSMGAQGLDEQDFSGNRIHNGRTFISLAGHQWVKIPFLPDTTFTWNAREGKSMSFRVGDRIRGKGHMFERNGVEWTRDMLDCCPEDHCEQAFHAALTFFLDGENVSP